MKLFNLTIISSGLLLTQSVSAPNLTTAYNKLQSQYNINGAKVVKCYIKNFPPPPTMAQVLANNVF